VRVGGDHTINEAYAPATPARLGVGGRLAGKGCQHGESDDARSGDANGADAKSGEADGGDAESGGSESVGGPARSKRIPAARPPADAAQPLALDSAVEAEQISPADIAASPAGFDDPSFRDYVVARSRALLRTAYLLTGNKADAEDLVQSALAKTYLAWDRIEDRGALDGYVRRAMVNTHISWWRRRRLEEFPTDEIPDQAVADPTLSSDMHESLQRAIDRLPQRMRAAVMLRYYEDMTEAEIADVLGISLGTVKSTVSRAVAKLRIDAELQSD
jgi:RNA polymerase sigma-70 factor (sigma-E family)